jgi:regulatory protein
MATITAIERQKRRPRFDVYLDGSEVLTLSADLVAEKGLVVGQSLSEAQRNELAAEEGRRGAIAAALRLLAATPRSEKDLRERLRRRAFKRDAVEAAIGRVRELGYLDDAAFARSWVEARQSATPRSRRALAFELGRRGVGREIAATAVESLSDADAAYEAAQRRLRALRGLDRQTFTRRLGTFLASRGFGYGIARQVIDRCWLEVTEAAT